LSWDEPAFRPSCAADELPGVSLVSLLESLLSTPQEQLVKCALCPYRTSCQAVLEQHISSTHLSVSKPQLQCEFCDLKLHSEAQLQLHVRQTHDEVPVVYECEVCHKHLWSRPQFERHQRKHYARTFGCSSCSKTYPSKGSLRLHISTKHMGLKPVPCECNVCGRVLKSRSNLVVHMRSHGQRSLECSVCGWRTKTSNCLRSHMDTHAAEKKYLCDTCGQKFFCVGSLRRHRALHDEPPDTRHECEFCGKNYKTKESLFDHLKVHQGRFDHACDLCDNAYVRKDKLIRHRLRKHNVKEYKCLECPLEYAKLAELKQHHLEQHFQGITTDDN
jgi:KRAB domain-containing zinc finger protein